MITMMDKPKQKKVGILTFHRANNYGAVLQTYALCSILNNFSDINAEIIDYKCSEIEKSRECHFNVSKKIKRNIKEIVKFFFRKRKNEKFSKWTKQYLILSATVFDRTNIQTSNSKYNIFVSGSDQVWNNTCTNFDYTYFLDFVNEKNKSCSYAASMGTYEFLPQETSEISNCLKKFSKLSVREKTTVSEIASMSSANVILTLDPVALIDNKGWGKIMSKRLFRADYIFVYTVSDEVNVISCAQEYAKIHNCKLINNKTSVNFFAHCSPSDFLSWIYHAKYIFTNSFHGTMFSILFNKDFMADIELKNKQLKNNRIVELLKITNLESCTMKHGEFISVDYSTANNLLDIERNKSLRYINEITKLEV